MTFDDAETTPRPSRNALRIVLVDDDDVDRDTLRRLLSGIDLEMEVREFSRGQDLLDMTDLAAVDCVLLDYRLPDLDGLQVIAALVGGGKVGAPGPAVILMTGVGDERLAVQAIQVGAADHLAKGGLSVDQLGRALRNALEQKRLRAEVAEMTRALERLSLHDSLSGLPNRNLYLERLQQLVKGARRSGESFALLVMDLDGFKAINENLGHRAGDHLIREVGRRLRDSCRDSDTVARIGGDEFAAILPGATSVERAVVAARKIERAVGMPALLDQGPAQVGISIGIALFPEHGEEAETLYRNADSAMYLAKRKGEGHQVYHPHSRAVAEPWAMLASDLSEALRNDQFTLHHQPKIDMSTGELAGVEALIRWNHPELGLVQPLEFMPQIERTALIGPLTAAVLDKSLAQAASWFARGLTMPIAVNLSARLLDNEELPRMVALALERHGVPPEMLTLEVTETGLASNLADAGRLLGEIRDMGVRISIDDFGTGYTSLRSLMTLPLAEIKIDKIFIDGVGSRMMESAIVSSIVKISEGFGITVVAEGVEDEETWEQLFELGCHQGQGYLISRPMPAEALEAWIVSRHARPEPSPQAMAR